MMVEIIVCIKSVVMRPPEQGTVRSPELCELNPFDRPAIELSLRLAKEHGGSVTALTMGPPESSEEALREAMAMGASRGVLVTDPALAGSDTLVTSTVLATAIKRLSPFDLVVFGARTLDSDTGQVGPQVSVLLGLPLITGATSVARQGSSFMVERRCDGFRERFEADLPLALCVHPRALAARDVPLAGLELAYARGRVETLGLSELGLSPKRVGWEGSPTQVLSMKRLARDRKCEFIEGSIDEQAAMLLKMLTEDGLIG